MAISVTTDLTVVSDAEIVGGGYGTYWRTYGASSANPGVEMDSKVENTGCMGSKCSGNVYPTYDVGQHFNHISTFDCTNKHIFIWVFCPTIGNNELKANGGMMLGLSNTSWTGTTAWLTTNYKRWFVDGRDTQPITAGWKCYVIDPTSAGDLSAGTLTVSTIKNIGIHIRQITGVVATAYNLLSDVIRIGNGVTATADSAGDTITFVNIYDVDRTNANAWGILTAVSGIYYGSGKFNIGSASQVNTCAFTDASQVLVWRAYPVASTLYEFLIKGASGNKTTMQLTSCIIRGEASTVVWRITCNDVYSDFKAYGCAFANLGASTLSAASVLSNTSFSLSNTITTNGASVTGCTFTNPIAAALTTTPSANAAAITGCTFTSDGTGYGLELTGTAADFTFTGNTFTGYAASDGTTGNEAIFVNIATGTMTISISGGSTPSIRTAGCAVTVLNTKTLTFTNLVTGSDIVITTSDTNTVILSIDQNAGTTYEYSYAYAAGTYVDIKIIKAGYVPYPIYDYLLANTNASLPIAQDVDRAYV